LFIIVSGLAYLTSCQTTKTLSIQILVPAQVTLPADQSHFILINRIPLLSEHETPDSIDAGNIVIPFEYYEQLSWEAINGALSVLDQSPKIDTVVLDTLQREELERTFDVSSAVLDSSVIQSICSGTSATGLIVLEDMKLSDSIDATPMFLADSSDILAYYAYELLYPGILWRVYSCRGELLHEIRYSDTLIWEGSGMSPQDAVNQIPPLEQILVNGIQYAGRIFAYSIAPTWVEVRRMYFSSGNKDMREASRFAGENNWDAAARIWQVQAETTDPELASNAAFNMALVSEINDRIDLAMTWINKSYELRGDDITMRYAQILRTRFNQRRELSKQIRSLEY